MAAFEGLRERDFFVLLEYDDDVETFTPHPFRIDYKLDGRRRVYTPDVLVHYREGPNGKPIRRSELCEVKIRSQFRKSWSELRPRLRAAQRYGRSSGWRFRLIHEDTVPRPFVGTLHFLLGYRETSDIPEIRVSLSDELARSGAISVESLVAQLSSAGHSPGDAVLQIWRLVALGEVRLDFEHSIGMRSRVEAKPWRVREVIHELRARSRVQRKEGMREEGPIQPKEGELIGAAGSDVIPLERGVLYGRLDRPGAYRIVQFLDPETALVQEQVSGVLETVSVNQLAPFANRRSKGRAELMIASEEERAEAEMRYRAIAAFVDRRRVSLREAKEAAEKAGVALKTWRKWRHAYQRNPTLSSLMRRRRRDAGNKRLDPLVEAIVLVYVNRWLDSTDSITAAFRDLEDEVKRRNRENPVAPIVCPNFNTFYGRCKALPPHVVSERREGKRIGRLTHGLVRGGIEGNDYPLAIVQIDHTPLPIQVVDAEFRIPIGRPAITVAIDLFSRMVVGYYLSLEDPGDLSTGMAITNAMLPKKDLLERFEIPHAWPCSGRMRVIHVDNAGEFHGNMLELGCKEYSIELVFRKVKRPNYGGHIESYLGTLSERLRQLPGATLTGPDELGDRNPEKEAGLTLDEVERWFLWHLMEYHNSEHSGLHGQTPIDRWRDGFQGSATEPGVGKLYIPSDVRKLRIDFLPLEERTVGPKGIVWDHIWYSDPSLQKWVNARDPKNQKLPRQFICRRDTRDLSRIYFWEPDIREYRVISYRNPTRPGMSLWEYRMVRKYIADQGRTNVDEDIIFEARQERRRILEEAVHATAHKRRAREGEKRRHAEAQSAIVQVDVGVVPAPSVDPVPPGLLAEEDIEPFEG